MQKIFKVYSNIDMVKINVQINAKYGAISIGSSLKFSKKKAKV